MSCAKTTKDIFEIFSPSGSQAILVFPHQTGGAIPTGTPLTGASNARGYEKMTIFDHCLAEISETVIVRWAHAARQFVSIEFLFPSIQHFSMIAPGASPGETKMWAAVRENGDFFAVAVRITGKLFKIGGYML